MAYRDLFALAKFYWPCDDASGASTIAAAIGGVNLTPGASSAKPTFAVTGQVDGTAIRFDAVDDYAAGTINLSPYTDITIVALLNLSASYVADAVFWEHTNNAGGTNGGFLLDGNPAVAANNFYVLHRLGGQSNVAYTPRPGVGWIHLAIRHNSSAAGTSEITVFINGSPVSLVRSPAPNTTGNFANSVFNLMSHATTSNFAGGDVQHLGIFNSSDLSDANIKAMSVASGLVTYDSVAIANSNLWDNGLNGAPANSPLARLVFPTSARYLRVAYTTDIFASAPAFAHIGVVKDGVPLTSLVATAMGTNYGTVDLGSEGTPKTVNLVSGAQSKVSTTVVGTYITALDVQTTYSATLQTPVNGRRVLTATDSIGNGANATNPELAGYAPLLRTSGNLRVMVMGYGTGRLKDYCADSTARTAFAAYVLAQAPDVLMITWCVNDCYNPSSWANVAAFQAAYAATLDAVHAAMPSLYVICQSAIVKASEAANAAGDTLPNYRTAISNAVSTRTAYAYYDDLATVLVVGDLDVDGLHPATGGHAKLYTHNYALLHPTLSVTGTATGGTYDFGSVSANLPTSHTFTIAAAAFRVGDTLGTLVIAGTGLTITGTNPSGADVLPGQSITVTVTANFSTAGSKTGSLTIPSNDPAGSYVINLTATAVAAPILAVTGTADNGTYAFGSVAANVDSSHQFTIVNNGIASDTLGTLVIAGAGWSISGVDNPSGANIVASGSTTVTVTGNFSSPGSKTGTLTIPSNDPATPYVINLTATASAPVVSADDDQLALSLELAM